VKTEIKAVLEKG